MKIQHWALIFIIIVLPFSIICRNTISKKNVLVRDETRMNNIIDNATYDAVSQIVEISEELGYGKKVPITYGVAEAAIDRFFNALSVNFNLPISREKAEDYFEPYIPAIVIVGYDGLYVYSCENTTNGFQFELKPKIPYAYTYKYNGNKEIVINFTLDNFVSIYFPNDKFLVGAPDANGVLDDDLNHGGTHILSGYIGEPLDVDGNGIYDLNDMMISGDYLLYEYAEGLGGVKYTLNDDPYGIKGYDDNTNDRQNYIKSTLPMFTENLSYILSEWAKTGGATGNTADYLSGFLYDDSNPAAPNQDYEYDEFRNVIKNPGKFHTLRRDTIINLIMSVLKEEFNEHNYYTKMLGITYEFVLPDIGRDDWNNTIDDISVLSFFQGMPIGFDSYYNNYSLGGTRIVQASYLYAETITEGQLGAAHKVYHKEYCPLIPREGNGAMKYSGSGAFDTGKVLPNGKNRWSSGIEQIFVNSDHAKAEGYHMCSECM